MVLGLATVVQLTVMLLVPAPDAIVPPALTVHVYPDMPASVVYVVVLFRHTLADPVIVGTGRAFTVTVMG
jgi:hypothetical protein